MSRTIDATAHIDNKPEAVIGYIADVRNRPLYLPSLKSVTDIKEAPGGTTWDTETSQNWDNNGSPDVFFLGDNVTFNDSNNGNYNVNIDAANSNCLQVQSRVNFLSWEFVT